MGANVSTSKYKSVFDSMTESTTDILTENINTVDMRGVVTQKVHVINGEGGTWDCAGGIQLTNNAEIEMNALSEIKSDQTIEMATEIANDMINKIQEEIKQTNEGLNLFQANVVDKQVKQVTTIRNKLTTNIKTSIENSIKQEASIGQDILVVNYGTIKSEGVCTFNNDAVINLVANNITDSVFDFIKEEEVITDIVNDYETEITQENVGIDPFASFGSLVTICIIAAVLIGGTAVMKPEYITYAVVGIIFCSCISLCGFGFMDEWGMFASISCLCCLLTMGYGYYFVKVRPMIAAKAAPFKAAAAFSQTPQMANVSQLLAQVAQPSAPVTTSPVSPVSPVTPSPQTANLVQLLAQLAAQQPGLATSPVSPA